MRFLGPHLILFGALLGAAAGAEPPAENAAGRTWKPTADWYRPDLRVPKLTPRSVEQSELRLQMGDDPRWAAPDWDDRAWRVIERTQVPLRAGIFWLRVRVRTEGGRERIPALVLGGASRAEEVFWDGVLIRANGTPGHSREAEIRGSSEAAFELPAAMTDPGEHVVALRLSTYGRARVGDRHAQLLLWTVPPEEMRALEARLNLFPAMGVGAMLTIGLAALVMWLLADRRPILLLFVALCVSAALLVGLRGVQNMWTFPASWAYIPSAVGIGLVVAVASLVFTMTITLFQPSRWRAGLLLALALEAAIAGFGLQLGVNVLRPILWRVAFAGALAVAGWAAWRRREGAAWVAGGLGATWLLFERDPKHFENTDFLLGFLPALVGFIAAIALQLRRERLQARDTRLTAARLEIELLRKNLQPHFLMNTLTALSQIIGEKPAAAVRLIDDLAGECRSLARVSGEKQIALGDELALCRAHLRVMSARTEQAWSLVTEGIEAGAAVPPALFLTLIENGFSHQDAQRDATAFALRAERAGDGVRYRFFSPGAVRPEAARAEGGTGLRYVRARLDESFPGAWKLSQGAVAGGWETVIELRAGAAA
jgi:hypothetical protein